MIPILLVFILYGIGGRPGSYYFRIIDMIYAAYSQMDAVLHTDPFRLLTTINMKIGQIPNHGKTGHINHIHRAGAQKVVLVES